MPKSVNKTVLAPGSRADASDSGVAAHGLGDNTRSPMSKVDEDMMGSLSSSVFDRDIDEEVEERRQAAGQAVGH